MAGFSQRIAGDWDKFKDALYRLGNVNFTALNKRLGETALSQVADRFKAGTDLEGKEWPKSGRAIATGGRTLRQTGKLQRGITYKADVHSVAIGTNDIRAKILNYGGVIKPKKGKYLTFKTPSGKWARVEKVTIPKREFIGFSPDNIDELHQEANDFLEEVAKG
jgi:phage gpG-like protein